MNSSWISLIPFKRSKSRSAAGDSDPSQAPRIALITTTVAARLEIKLDGSRDSRNSTAQVAQAIRQLTATAGIGVMRVPAENMVLSCDFRHQGQVELEMESPQWSLSVLSLANFQRFLLKLLQGETVSALLTAMDSMHNSFEEKP